jgi:hypothetical protein
MFEYAKLLEFIDYRNGIKNYLHNTPEMGIPEKINEGGFEFKEALSKTADEINGDWEAALPWWDVQRGRYGIFTVVIQIDRGAYSRAGKNAVHLLPEHALSKGRCWDGEDDEWIYTLHPKYIKGYFDRKNDKGTANPMFDPHFFDEEVAERNIRIWDQEEGRMRTLNSIK